MLCQVILSDLIYHQNARGRKINLNSQQIHIQFDHCEYSRHTKTCHQSSVAREIIFLWSKYYALIRKSQTTLTDNKKYLFFSMNVKFHYFYYFIVISKERPKVCNSVLDAIGMTPLVKLNHIPQSLGIKCQMCKWFNSSLREWRLKISIFRCEMWVSQSWWFGERSYWL